MCGITGILNFEKGRGIGKEVLVEMADTLAHRGPDDSGFHVEEDFGLGFRRLSIIDLSTGNQPIFNEDKSVVTVCNGEIFNYGELKSLMISKGHVFRTNTDVEVLVHLYEEYGIELLDKINGQFAFALVDKNGGQTFLARDHAGIIPLFYTVCDGQFVFGSEIKAILKHPKVRREVDPTSLDQVFSFPAAISPRTMFKNIHSLEPGHWLRVAGGKVENREYWDLVYPDAGDIEYTDTESGYLEKLGERLRSSVEYRLVADVPVGMYLSGGVDSSLIAALVRDIYPGEQRHSFSVGFEQEEIDERKYQQIMAAHVDSIHHETVFDWPDIGARLKDLIRHAETPLKETYDTCLMALSRLARDNGVKAVLTGEGSDELFAGYVGYRFDQVRPDRAAPMDAEELMEMEIREKLWGDPDLLYERNQMEIRETKLAMYSKGLREKFGEFDSVGAPLIDKKKIAGKHPLHKRSYLDFKLRLPDHLLSDHGDRVSYANSIEARFPYLDINLVEFVKTIPPGLQLKNSAEKYLLRNYARKFVPEQILQREKFAFVAPGSPYLLKQNIEWVNDLLSRETIKRQGYFDPDTIERLKKIYLSDGFMLNQNLENDLLMIVLTFGIFLETFDMPDWA